MANITREIKYRCFDDCEMSGCPGHLGILMFQSTSNAYSFSMNGEIMHFEQGQLQAMVDLIRALDRVDAVKLDRRSNSIGG